MDPEFWHERWNRDEIGFHQAHPAAALTRHWQELNLKPEARVFVPLCGKSLDLVWLRERGHTVVGVELSDLAVQAFCMENGIAARRRTLADFDLYEAPRLELYRGDFFALEPGHLGEINAVYDRAALISWTPKLRDRYAEQLVKLTSVGVETLLVTLEYPQSQKKGPPFSVEATEVERLYARTHTIHELSREDILDSEPRMRARGVTELDEVCYQLSRR